MTISPSETKQDIWLELKRHKSTLLRIKKLIDYNNIVTPVSGASAVKTIRKNSEVIDEIKDILKDFEEKK